MIGPRLTGSPAYREAAEWARERFESWGVSGSRLEPFEFGRGWSLEHYTLELVEPRTADRAARRQDGRAADTTGEQIYIYLNDDPGTGPIYGWYLEENTVIQPIFDTWLASFRPLGARKNVLDEIGSTDHLSFIAAGVPAFNTLKDYVDYDVRTHHTNADFFERVRERDLQQSAIVLAAFAYHAAMRDGPLPLGPARPATPEGGAR